MNTIFTSPPDMAVPVDDKIKKHRPGGKDHDQSSHGSWSDGSTVPPGTQRSPAGGSLSPTSTPIAAAPSGQVKSGKVEGWALAGYARQVGHGKIKPKEGTFGYRYGKTSDDGFEWGDSLSFQFEVDGKRFDLEAQQNNVNGKLLPGRGTVTVYEPESGYRTVGYLQWGINRPSEITDVAVDRRYQRKGIATLMLEAGRVLDPELHHSLDLSDKGKAWADVVKHYGPGPHRGTGSPQTVHGKKRHRGISKPQIDVKAMEQAVYEYDNFDAWPDDMAEKYPHWLDRSNAREALEAERQRLKAATILPAGIWRKGTIYQLADPDSMGLLELNEGWRTEFVGSRTKPSARQQQVLDRVEEIAPGLTEWLQDRGVSIVFSQTMKGYGFTVGEFLVTPNNGPTIWIQTAENAFNTWRDNIYGRSADSMVDTLLHEMGHAIDWKGTVTAGFVEKGNRLVSDDIKGKFKLSSDDASWDYDYTIAKTLRDWYAGSDNQTKAKYRYGSGGPPLTTEWFAEGFEHYAKDGTTGNDDYDTFVETIMGQHDDLPVKVSKRTGANTPSGLTDDEAAELLRISDKFIIPVKMLDGRNPRSQLDLFRRMKIRGPIRKHYGPGAHPSGSPQSAHGGTHRLSGVPEVDEAIKAFLREPVGDWTTDGCTVGNLTPEQAHGACEEIAEQFATFAADRGLKAYAVNTDLDELGYKIKGKPAGEVLDEDGNIVSGRYFTHTVNEVYLPNQAWPITIDFTASQYGYPTKVLVTKHYGPGPHPGTGTPQMVHSEEGRRKMASSLETVRWIAQRKKSHVTVDEMVDFNVSLDDDELWVYAWEEYRKEHYALKAEERKKVEAYLNGQLVVPDHPLITESWGRSKESKISGLESDLSEVDAEIMADNPWDEHGWGDGVGPDYHGGTFTYPEGFDQESWGKYVKDWRERKLIEIEETADAATKEIVDNSDVYIQIHRATLPEILDDGGFTTIHAVDAVGAIGEDFGTSHRLAYEEDTFGIAPDSLPPNMRPIYGYLWDSDDKDGAVIPENGLSLGNARTSLMKYGTVAVRLKPEVRDRTTFTFGDSYSLNMAVLPQPINDPSWLAHGFLGGIVGTGMIEGGARKPTEGMGWNKGWSYIEAQVHGGVTLDDIEEIIVDTPEAVERHSTNYDWVTEWSELETMLDDSGVPWRITDRPLT